MLALVMKNRRFNFILGSILPSSAQKPQNLISCQRDSAYRFSPKLSRPLLENLQSVSVSALKVLLTLAKISIILSVLKASQKTQRTQKLKKKILKIFSMSDRTSEA